MFIASKKNLRIGPKLFFSAQNLLKLILPHHLTVCVFVCFFNLSVFVSSLLLLSSFLLSLVFNVFFLLSYGNPAEHTTVKDSHGESYGDKTLWLSKTRQWKSWHCDSQFTGTLHSQWLQSQVGCASTASCHSSGCTQWLAILSLERKLDQNCCVIILWFMLLDMEC